MTTSQCRIATTGTVKDVQAGDLNPPLMIYEIETTHGIMRLPADWLEKLIRPGLEGRRTEPSFWTLNSFESEQICRGYLINLSSNVLPFIAIVGHET
jgi:hypothetical protein